MRWTRWSYGTFFVARASCSALEISPIVVYIINSESCPSIWIPGRSYFGISENLKTRGFKIVGMKLIKLELNKILYRFKMKYCSWNMLTPWRNIPEAFHYSYVTISDSVLLEGISRIWLTRKQSKVTATPNARTAWNSDAIVDHLIFQVAIIITVDNIELNSLGKGLFCFYQYSWRPCERYEKPVMGLLSEVHRTIRL
jgi:hypothetical protein